MLEGAHSNPPSGQEGQTEEAEAAADKGHNSMPGQQAYHTTADPESETL